MQLLGLRSYIELRKISFVKSHSFVSLFYLNEYINFLLPGLIVSFQFMIRLITFPPMLREKRMSGGRVNQLFQAEQNYFSLYHHFYSIHL